MKKSDYGLRAHERLAEKVSLDFEYYPGEWGGGEILSTPCEGCKGAGLLKRHRAPWETHSFSN